MLHAIDALRRNSGAQRTSPTSSWTGDVHNVDRIHLDPAFDWLTRQVGAQALEYLGALGHNLSKTDVYIQRAWPIVAARDQRVARHAHHTAHLSAVYYLAGSRDAAGGQIRFFNDGKPNQVAPGIDSDMTAGYSEHHALNYGSAVYAPVPGRLILFPAKLSHSVEPNTTDDPRISISFDLVITSRGGAEDGRHEFLMPPPVLWSRVDRGESAPAPAGPARHPAFVTVPGYQPIDDYALPSREGHPLWETTLLPHVSSPAAWAQYRAALDGIAPEDWWRDHSGALLLWQGCEPWRAWQDAVARVHAHLRNHDVPLADAGLGTPQIQRRSGALEPPFQRGRKHLCAYLRIDHDETPCMIEFAEGGAVPVAPGTLAIVAGARRHRLTGDSCVLHFQLDLPALARINALGHGGLQPAEVLDTTVFAAIAAQPLAAPMPAPEALFDKIRWIDTRDRRRSRSALCPTIQRLLIDHGDPQTASAAELAIVRNYGTGGDSSDRGRLFIAPGTLDAAACAELRAHADAHMTSVVPDTVDDLPEYQVNLSLDGLSDLIGAERAATLLALPESVGAPPVAAPSGYERISIFLRVYSQDTRRYIPFHADLCDYTVNIALNDDTELEGGRLLALDGATLRSLEREAGTAIVHAGNLVHGVTRIERGIRHSLILFLHPHAQ
jgi:uncharacterized protein (TIGR02466 family)